MRARKDARREKGARRRDSAILSELFSQMKIEEEESQGFDMSPDDYKNELEEKFKVAGTTSMDDAKEACERVETFMRKFDGW